MFGGVDQLLREGQDWIFRDQTQLANGFENWNPGNIDDIASWFASAQSPTGGFTGAASNPAMSGQMNGGPVGGAYGGNGNVNGGGSGNMNAVGQNGAENINGLQGFTYDEGSWYDYQ